MDAPIKATLPYFGGKRSMAALISHQLGPHRQYFEPFCGSLAVLFGKPVAKQETVADLHGDCTNLARALQDATTGPALFDRLQRTLFSEGLYQEALQATADPPQLEPGQVDGDRAYWYFLASWQGLNGVAGCTRKNFQLAVRWTANGGSATTRWQSAVASVPAWHDRLQKVVILTRDAFDVLPNLPDVEHCVIYCDPPYLADTRSMRSSRPGESIQYQHDFQDRGPATGLLFDAGDASDDHERLAHQLQKFKRTRVVVSYYQHPRLATLYPGWHQLKCDRVKHLTAAAKTTGKACRGEAPEVLLINGEPMP